MAEEHIPVVSDSAQQELRRRHASAASSDAEVPTNIAEAASWRAQLADARRVMAIRMEQQDPYKDTSTATSAGSESGHPTTAGHSDPASHGRRVSVASSEGDDELVEALLRPHIRPTAAPVEEIPSEEADDGIAHSHENSQEDGATHATPSSAPQEDDRVCRICFGGADDEAELGRLFSPCVCRGTSRHVHKKCLESWRKAAVNPRAFYECPQCKYAYNFRRTAFARVITSTWTVTFLTSIVFMLIVFVSGFLANSLIAAVEARQSLAPSLLNDLFIPDHILAGEGIREAVSFVENRLEQSRWVAGRDLALQRAAQDDSTSYRFFNPNAMRKRNAAPQPPPFLLTATLHAVKGSALLGIMATFYTYAAATFMSPLGRTLFRALRPAGARRRAADRAASMSQLVVIFLIIVGVIKSVRQVYRGVKWLTRIALSRVEDLVIEVNA